MPRRGKRSAGLGLRRAKKKINANRNLNRKQVNNNDNLVLPCLNKNPTNVGEKDPPSDLSLDESVRQYQPDKMVIDENAKVCKMHQKICTVAYLFETKYKGLEEQVLNESWGGRHGIAVKIKKDMGLTRSQRNDFEPIFLHVIECARTGKEFKANEVMSHGGRSCKIPSDSIQAQIVADAIEMGLSTVRAWHLLNSHEIDEGREAVSLSAVMSLVSKLKPKLVHSKKRKQGSKDPNDLWCRARYLQCKQLLVRFGKLSIPDPPPCFDPRVIGTIELSQVVWWDETHRKCTIGGFSGSRTISYKFRRDENGKLDDAGEFSQKEVSVLNCKYEKEGRFGLGCAVVCPRDTGVEVGRVCRPFDYSGKTILSIDDYDKQIEQEFRRVRQLSDNTKTWITKNRNPQDLYLDDPLSLLGKVGKKTQTKLEDAGIKCVGDLKKYKPEDLKNVPGMSEKTLTFIWSQCQLALDRNAPPVTDHRKSPNPYKSKYGEDWRAKLKACPSLSSYVSIADYVMFIVDESARIMAGTKHANDWVFYHDALSLMTAKKTKEFMRQKNIYKRWLLPTQDLYQNSPELFKRYKDNPIGNSPEFMPWDSHLNQDLHSAHDHHVTLTNHLDDQDPRKFDGSTPKRIASSYNRLLAICPTSDRVLQDCSRVLDAFQAVYDAKGVILEEVGERRRGRRRVSKTDEEESKRGGTREKKEYKRHANLHPALNTVTSDIYNASTVAFSSGSSTRDENGDEILGVNVKGRFEEDSDSIDMSEL